MIKQSALIFALETIRDNKGLNKKNKDKKPGEVKKFLSFVHDYQNEIVVLQKQKLIIFLEQTGVEIRPQITELGNNYLMENSDS